MKYASIKEYRDEFSVHVMCGVLRVHAWLNKLAQVDLIYYVNKRGLNVPIKKQIDTFRGTARELECDESKEGFDEILKKLAKRVKADDRTLKKDSAKPGTDEQNLRSQLKK